MEAAYQGAEPMLSSFPDLRQEAAAAAKAGEQ